LFLPVLFALPGCKPSAQPVSEVPAPAVSEAKPPSPPTATEQELMSRLADDGAQVMSGLGAQSDVAHGATWFKGDGAATGSTAYLYLGKLGEGASTLRFVVRHEGPRAAALGNCTAIVDGVEAGSFALIPNKFENLPGGNVMQLADAHFDDVRPIVLGMINGQSAVIRTSDGAEIRLGRAELDDMRRVLSAYLHLQSSAP
jgi:hypothetical protein